MDEQTTYKVGTEYGNSRRRYTKRSRTPME
jgi:hypothetical protein